LYQWTPQRRRLDYYRYIGASQQTAREIKAFGLRDWITDRYSQLANEYYLENKRLSKRRALVSSLLAIVSEAGYYLAYVLIILDTISGAITVGTLTFLSGSFMQARNRFESIFNEATRVQQGSLYLKDLFDFFEVEPTIRNVESPLEVPRPLKSGVTFDGVSFRYPGSENWALRDLNLHIAPGERVALVGENGAGKSTIAKLMARLYDPTEGRVLLDGVDLREYRLDELRASIGIIFQDFVRYDLRLVENVGLGDIARSGPVIDRRENDEDVWRDLESAADKSLATSLVDRLPEGWDQMLGRRFESGVELSGGEWQKIALARAHLRDAQILILDEPTASLDARAEYEVFLRFSELVQHRLAVIISHRFSTVRMADTIHVLKGGRLQESGSHSELIERAGLYAELFNMQAEGYRDSGLDTADSSGSRHGT
jgi:ATP-binding cassette subfamily B protein